VVHWEQQRSLSQCVEVFDCTGFGGKFSPSGWSHARLGGSSDESVALRVNCI
jgi:hypothetical protein